MSGRRKVAQSVEGCEVKERVEIYGQRERPAARIGRGIEDLERDQTISKMPVIITLVVRQGGWACAVMGGIFTSDSSDISYSELTTVSRFSICRLNGPIHL